MIVSGFRRGGKTEADAMINSGIGDQLRDSIYKYATSLQTEFGNSVHQNLEANYTKSKSLKPFITILTLLSFIAIVALSIRVVYRINQKNKLIRRLRIA